MTVRAAPGGRLRLRELERTVLLTQSGVSRLVDRLARHGLLDRCADPGDRRAVLVGLSAEGRRRLRRAKALAQTHVESAFLAHLDDRELACLHAALDRVVAAARDRAAGPDG
jgi:DNA-binding MarR family transcriptional regulator